MAKAAELESHGISATICLANSPANLDCSYFLYYLVLFIILKRGQYKSIGPFAYIEAGAVSPYGSACVTGAHAPFTDDQSA